MLATLVNKDFVTIGANVWNWEEAVVFAGDLMRRMGCVEESYVHSMIETTKTMGPYVVIAPGIALAHARPEDGVNQTCVSFTTLRKPVVFGNPEHDPVRLVIGLAAVDNDIHLDVMTYLAKIISDEVHFARIFACKTAEEVVRLIQSADLKRCERILYTA